MRRAGEATGASSRLILPRFTASAGSSPTGRRGPRPRGSGGGQVAEGEEVVGVVPQVGLDDQVGHGNPSRQGHPATGRGSADGERRQPAVSYGSESSYDRAKPGLTGSSGVGIEEIADG